MYENTLKEYARFEVSRDSPLFIKAVSLLHALNQEVDRLTASQQPPPMHGQPGNRHQRRASRGSNIGKSNSAK